MADMTNITTPLLSSGERNIDLNRDYSETAVEESNFHLTECRICHELDFVGEMESPCDCKGTLKFAHRKCVQRWIYAKASTTCEICQKTYQSDYTAPLVPPPSARGYQTSSNSFSNIFLSFNGVGPRPENLLTLPPIRIRSVAVPLVRPDPNEVENNDWDLDRRVIMVKIVMLLSNLLLLAILFLRILFLDLANSAIFTDKCSGIIFLVWMGVFVPLVALLIFEYWPYYWVSSCWRSLVRRGTG